MIVKEKIEKIKESYLFRRLDLFLYLGVTAIIVALFLVFVIFPTRSLSDGFQVIVGEEVAITYHYDDTYSIAEDFIDKVEVNIDNDICMFKINNDTNGYNVISVDVINKTVRVTESNCSVSKECVHTPELTINGGAIICVPHNLKIIPLGNGYRPPVIG